VELLKFSRDSYTLMHIAWLIKLRFGTSNTYVIVFAKKCYVLISRIEVYVIY